MNRFFKTFFIFFALATVLLLMPTSIQTQPTDNCGYIQNIKAETVTLLSNNLLNTEISSSEDLNEQIFSGSTPLILTYQSNENLFNQNKTQSNGNFIHNLSTDNPKVHSIRAP